MYCCVAVGPCWLFVVIVGGVLFDVRCALFVVGLLFVVCVPCLLLVVCC